jgi:beta-aspartyl-dipeptidase (metallo-type)
VTTIEETLMLTLIENGEIYAPGPQGQKSILLADSKIAKVGNVERRAVQSLGLEVEIIDAAGCLVTPGFIDPHEHLLGGSGEKGFSTQTPEIYLSEIVTAGITTVVGCLGADTTMKTLPGLLAKAKALKEEGVSAFIWSGGYSVPPTTIMKTIRDDILFIDEVIGAGEVAISDERSTEPRLDELAKLVSDAHAGGMLSKKAGVTHFHVGEGDERLSLLGELLARYEVKPDWLYATHIERSEALMEEAIEMAARGVFVDIDTVEEDLPRWLRFYLERGGPVDQLTVSSDASISSPRNVYEQVRACAREHGFPLEQVLKLVTSNTARALKLENKGRLEAGKDADVLVLKKSSLEIVDVIANGRLMVKRGELVANESFLEESNRSITLHGRKLNQG